MWGQTMSQPKAVDNEDEASAVKIEPAPGSEAITFSNYTSASLGGCITSGILELQHQGVMEDAIILLKNEAFRHNNNMLIVTKMSSTSAGNSNTIKIEARMLACPIKLARGN